MPDALTALVRLLATLHDDAGDVAVDGLVGREGAAVDYPEDRFRAEAGLLDGVQLIGTGRITDRLWTKPAIVGARHRRAVHRRGAERPGPGREGQAQRPPRARATTPSGRTRRCARTWRSTRRGARR